MFDDIFNRRGYNYTNVTDGRTDGHRLTANALTHSVRRQKSLALAQPGHTDYLLKYVGKNIACSARALSGAEMERNRQKTG